MKRINFLKWEFIIMTKEEYEKLEKKISFKTYHEILNYVCDKYGVPGSQTLYQAISWIKTYAK